MLDIQHELTFQEAIPSSRRLLLSLLFLLEFTLALSIIPGHVSAVFVLIFFRVSSFAESDAIGQRVMQPAHCPPCDIAQVPVPSTKRYLIDQPLKGLPTWQCAAAAPGRSGRYC